MPPISTGTQCGACSTVGAHTRKGMCSRATVQPIYFATRVRRFADSQRRVFESDPRLSNKKPKHNPKSPSKLAEAGVSTRRSATIRFNSRYVTLSTPVMLT